MYMARLEKEKAELPQKREEEARRYREESAFDGDTAVIRQLLKEVRHLLVCGRHIIVARASIFMRCGIC